MTLGLAIALSVMGHLECEEMKPNDIPEDIWDAVLNGPVIDDPVEAICRAIIDERERCVRICHAEREWGGELQEACARIESGKGARVIPGWNAPSEG